MTCARCSNPLQKRDTGCCYQCSPSRRFCGECLKVHMREPHRNPYRPSMPPMATATPEAAFGEPIRLGKGE